MAGPLEELYRGLNRKEFVHPDPLEFLHRYPDPRDREVVGLIASGLAYGQVGQILKDVERALAPLGPSPHRTVRNARPARLRRLYPDFKHRWTTGADLADLLIRIQRELEEAPSLEESFLRGYRADDEDIRPALSRFVAGLTAGGRTKNSLLADPASGSACKRLHLYLRWMVRRDDVDPGGWDRVSPARLVIPLDTHMFRIGRRLRFTRRRQADGRAALEVTRAFRKIVPEDPVRYDFALTRLGMRPGLDLEGFLRRAARARRGKP